MSSAVFGYWSGALSFAINFRGRTVKDVGSLTTMAAAFPGCNLTDLTIMVPNPDTQPVAHDDIMNAIVQHVQNSNVEDTWSPPNGMTLAGVLQKELATYLEAPFLSGSSRHTKCIFNGQFGPLQLASA